MSILIIKARLLNSSISGMMAIPF